MNNKTKLKNIGIIGGAGPMAGVLMLKYIVQICQKKYGCYQDEDFPQIILINFPFAPMLTPCIANNNDILIKKQLNQTISNLLPHCAVLSIACNTLHAFIDSNHHNKILNMITLTQKTLINYDIKNPLILGTSTSRQRSVHDFPGIIYPDGCDLSVGLR